MSPDLDSTIMSWLLLYGVPFVLFFYKQKTAYEMRISDWSSDVCSSDLFSPPRRCSPRAAPPTIARPRPPPPRRRQSSPPPRARTSTATPTRSKHRSEEHTSELQSLMRISYAVFCLKKKNNKNKMQQPNIQHKKTQLTRTRITTIT